MRILRPEGPRLKVRVHGSLRAGAVHPDMSSIADLLDVSVQIGDDWVPGLGRWTGTDRGPAALSRATDAGRFSFSYGGSFEFVPDVDAVSPIEGGVLVVTERVLCWPLLRLHARPWPATAVFALMEHIGAHAAALDAARENAPSWGRMMSHRHLDTQSVWLRPNGEPVVWGYDPAWLFHTRQEPPPSAGRLFTAPELARGGDVPATEVFQLAVLAMDLFGALPEAPGPDGGPTTDAAWAEAVARLPADVPAAAKQLLALALASWSGARPGIGAFMPFADVAAVHSLIDGLPAPEFEPTDTTHPLSGREFDVARRLAAPPQEHTLMPEERSWALRPPAPVREPPPDRWTTLPFRRLPTRPALQPRGPRGDESQSPSDPAAVRAGTRSFRASRWKLPPRRRYFPGTHKVRGVLVRRRGPARPTAKPDHSRTLLIAGTVLVIAALILGIVLW